MKRRGFYSFHYAGDSQRASQVRNIGAIEGNAPASDNDWETVTSAGDGAIKRWINGQLDGRTVTIVLVGAHTAGRKWINYEIEQSWQRGMGVLGIRIHGLKNLNGHTTRPGANPFDKVTIAGVGSLSSRVPLKTPSGIDSKAVYASISSNLSAWIEEAIAARKAVR